MNDPQDQTPVNNPASMFTTIAEANAVLAAQMQANEEASNIVGSIVSSGVLTGTVTNSSNVRLPSMKIVVLGFNNWVTRAVARTDANGVDQGFKASNGDGTYSISLPTGTYKVRACVPGACSGTFIDVTIAAGSNTQNFAL